MLLDTTYCSTNPDCEKYINITKKQNNAFPNTSFTQSLNQFYSYVSYYRNRNIGSQWKNAGKHLWRAVSFLVNIQNMTLHQL